MKKYTSTIIILTLNAEKEIEKILEKINFKKYHVIIIDSSSEDNTIKLCKKYNCKIKVINKDDFNHGGTREYARNLTKTDIVVFFTQDAIPTNHDTIHNLISPLLDGKASVAYARQLPKKGSDIFESFPREHNYGDRSQIRSIKDIKKYGQYTFFSSDSCSAYVNSDLDLVGGIEPTIVSEDYFNAVKLLLAGKKIAYVSEAEVYHSHKYSLINEFQRMFDTGYARAEKQQIKTYEKNTTRQGLKYTIALFRKLIIQNPLLIPYAILQTIVKYTGYKVGLNSIKFPTWLKKLFSGQKYYWSSKYYVK